MNVPAAVLLAAGRGSRLSPLTHFWPKCLMPIQGRPLLDYWVRLLTESDVQTVFVNTHTHAEIVSEYLSRPDFSGKVVEFHESQLLGTAGTLRSLAPLLTHGPLIVAHADNLCDCDFNAFVASHENRPQACAVTMMSFKTPTPHTCGIITINGDGIVTGLEEKPSMPESDLANAAVYIFEREVIDFIVANPTLGDVSLDVLPHFLGRIQAWHNDQVLRDIGNSTQLVEAQRDRIRKLPLPTDLWQESFEESLEWREIRGFLGQ
ncbi:MAG: UTP--glucose-1-phosphate uridylyltransferase [Nitrosomonadaceae bacterium]|nr:UTP--glucose-1-phosphate uridylyltransferase [Nitrosomonadaceae bacterium]